MSAVDQLTMEVRAHWDDLRARFPDEAVQVSVVVGKSDISNSMPCRWAVSIGEESWAGSTFQEACDGAARRYGDAIARKARGIA